MNQRGQLTTGCGVFRAPLNLDWAAAARMGSKDHVVVGLVLAMALVAAPGSRLLLLRSRSTQLMTPTGSDEGTTNMGRQIRKLLPPLPKAKSGSPRTGDCRRHTCACAAHTKTPAKNKHRKKTAKTLVASSRHRVHASGGTAGLACWALAKNITP